MQNQMGTARKNGHLWFKIIGPLDHRTMTTSGSTKFEAWWREYQRTASLGAVQLGVSRETITSLFGEPDAVGNGFRHQPKTCIWRFGAVEFHFDTDGRLFLIFTEDEHGRERVIAKSDAPKP